MSRKSVPPEAILDGLNPEIVKLVKQLQDLVLESAPEAFALGYLGWRAVVFRHPGAGYVCGAFPSDEEVKFLFEQGIHLNDPAGVLEGSTKQTRHVTLRPGEPLPHEALEALIMEAVAYGEARHSTRKPQVSHDAHST